MLPYIIISAVSILIFDIVYYFFFIQQKPLYSISVCNILIPACFALAVHLLFVLPLTLRVNFHGKNNRFVANLLPLMMLSFSIVISVFLVRDLTAEVKTVNSVTEIDPQSNGRYFKIAAFDIDRTKVGASFWITKHTRKHRPSQIVLNLSLAAPVKINSTPDEPSIYWFCEDYDYNTKKTVIVDSDKDDFNFNTYKDFLSPKTINNVIYLERVPKNWVDSHDILAV
jgi:hypothetical protein